MVLLKDGQIAEEHWAHAADDAALPAGPVTVSAERWRRERPQLVERNAPIGIRLAPEDDPALLKDDIARFDLICLHFGSFADGRPYSQARLLRERFGYRGELRAEGQVLRDQFAFLHRCGINGMQLTKASDAAAWEEALTEIKVRYQPAGDTGPTAAMYRRGASSAFPV